MKSILCNWRRGFVLLGLAGACATPLWAADEHAATDDQATTGAQSAAPMGGLSVPMKSPQDAAKPVAKINGETVTQGDVDKYVQDTMQQQMQRMAMQGQPPQGEQIEQMQKAIAGHATIEMVKQKMMDQAVSKEVGTVTDAELNEHIDQLRKLLKSRNRDLDEMLKSQGKSIDDVKKDMRKQLAFYKLAEREEGVKPPSEEEIKALYDEHQKEMTVPEQVRASHILIGFEGDARDPNRKPPTDAEKAEKKKKAEDVLARAKKGEDFAKLAQENSSDPGSKIKGGDLDFFGRGMMTKNFEDAAFTAKAGDITDLVETEFGYHIIKVVDHKSTTTMGLDDVKFQLREKLMGDRVREKIPDLMAKLQKNAKIELMDGSKMPEPEAAPAHPMGMPMQKPGKMMAPPKSNGLQEPTPAAEKK